MNLRDIILITLLVLSPLVSAHNKKSSLIKGAIGKYEITREISEAYACEKALEAAKLDALRKGGITENVWSVFGLITAQDGRKFAEAYSEMSLLSQNGYVTIISEPKYNIITDPADGRRYAIATIDARVKEAEMPDRSHKIEVSGVESIYREGEQMEFTLKPVAYDTYFHIFWFDNSGTGSQIYPFRAEMNGRAIEEALTVVRKGEKLSLPNTDSGFKIRYKIVKTNPANEIETFNFIVVGTKKEYHYPSEEITFESLLKWIYDIPAYDRAISYNLITVK